MLTENEKKLLQRYEKMAQIPKWKYVLIYGVLAWGVFVAVLMTVFVDVLFKSVTWSDVLRKNLWTNLLTFMIAGIFYGLFIRKWVVMRQIKILREKEVKE